MMDLGEIAIRRATLRRTMRDTQRRRVWRCGETLGLKCKCLLAARLGKSEIEALKLVRVGIVDVYAVKSCPLCAGTGKVPA